MQIGRITPLRLCFGLRLVSEKIGTSAFISSNSENVPPRLNRGKLTHIQHPALRYFALFLARDNSLACTSPIVYLPNVQKKVEAVSIIYELFLLGLCILL
jgi:hypothetical protein